LARALEQEVRRARAERTLARLTARHAGSSLLQPTVAPTARSPEALVISTETVKTHIATCWSVSVCAARPSSACCCSSWVATKGGAAEHARQPDRFPADLGRPPPGRPVGWRLPPSDSESARSARQAPCGLNISQEKEAWSKHTDSRSSSTQRRRSAGGGPSGKPLPEVDRGSGRQRPRRSLQPAR